MDNRGERMVEKQAGKEVQEEEEGGQRQMKLGGEKVSVRKKKI